MDLSELRQKHAGETILVLGGGESVRQHPVKSLRQFTTIGMNQIARLMVTEYTTFLDPPREIARQGGLKHPLESLRGSQCVISSQYEGEWNEVCQDHEVEQDFAVFRWGLRGSWLAYSRRTPYEALAKEWEEGGTRLPFAQTSVGLATFLALYMGAARIGILGLDLTPGYFWDKRRVFSQVYRRKRMVQRELERMMNQRMGAMATAIKAVWGVPVFNLSKVSRVRSIPRANLKEWLQAQPPEPSATAKSSGGKRASSKGSSRKSPRTARSSTSSDAST